MTDKTLSDKAKLVRKWSLISTTEGGSGHPTTCLSAADLTTVLFDKYFFYDLKNPLNEANDRLIFSKGHAAPLLYTLFALAGAMPLEELRTLRKFTSRLEGHPTPAFVYTDAATGSLGQGLSVGSGLAYLAKNEKLPFKTYVLLGDGELAEGQVWEAANFASHYKLDNLIAFADINRLGQSQPTMFEHKMDEYVKRFSAFGFIVELIDGHDLSAIDKALAKAVKNKSGKPFVIVAKTFKGRGISFLEDQENWHGKPLKKEDLEKALKELGEIDDSLRFTLHKAGSTARSSQGARSSEAFKKFTQGKLQRSARLGNPPLASPASSQYKIGDEIGTREVYGQILARIGEIDGRVYVLDTDVKNSTYSQDFLKAHPDRFIECFIAEQNMVGVAIGLSRLQRKPFVSTFASFLTRAADQIRMAGLSKSNITFVGSHAGVSIGEDGASQMGLEDVALFGTIPGSVVIHPSDAVSTAYLIKNLYDFSGISYLRTLRPKTPILYKPNDSFRIGGSKILRSSNKDVLTVAACGITVHEALTAYEILKKEGILIRVIDCYSVKPIDQATLANALQETKKKVIVSVEDHYEHGGFGDFVRSAVYDRVGWVEKMAVTKFSRSGTKNELLDDAGISASNIVKKVKSLL